MEVEVEIEVEVGGSRLIGPVRPEWSGQRWPGAGGRLRISESPPGEENDRQSVSPGIQTLRNVSADLQPLRCFGPTRLCVSPVPAPPFTESSTSSSWQNPRGKIAPLVERSERTAVLRVLQGPCPERSLRPQLPAYPYGFLHSVTRANGGSPVPLAVRGQR